MDPERVIINEVVSFNRRSASFCCGLNRSSAGQTSLNHRAPLPRCTPSTGHLANADTYMYGGLGSKGKYFLTLVSD